MRTLPKSPAIEKIFTDWDDHLLRAILLLRGSRTQPEHYDEIIVRLPVRHGGLGMLPHGELQCFAREAMEEECDERIEALLDPLHEMRDVQRQRERCQDWILDRLQWLKDRCDVMEKRALAENQSTLASVWLSVIPYNNYTKLPSHVVATGLHYRTLLPGHHTTCRYCYMQNRLGHDEVCMRRQNLRTYRHEQLKKTIAYYLELDGDTKVQVEPHVPGSLDRTDLRIAGPASYLQESCEIDLTVTSIYSQAVPIPNPSQPDVWVETLANIERHLNSRAATKIHQYAARTVAAFHPLAMTSGGILHAEANLIFEHWRTCMSKSLWKFFRQDMGISLLRTRARVFSV